MVSGRPPFTGENPVSIAYKQVHDAPQPLVQLVADVPRAFEAIVAKLLAKDQSCATRVRAHYATTSAVSATTSRSRRSRQLPRRRVLPCAATTVRLPVLSGQPRSTPPSHQVLRRSNRRSGGVPQAGMYEAGYHRGASPDAAYYDSDGSRTGWYALAAFVALMRSGRRRCSALPVVEHRSPGHRRAATSHTGRLCQSAQSRRGGRT